MITVNMHEAKTRLSELVRAVEEEGEVVILCRAGKQVAEIRSLGAVPVKRRELATNPRFAVRLAPGYDPTEPLAGDEWPEDCR